MRSVSHGNAKTSVVDVRPLGPVSLHGDTSDARTDMAVVTHEMRTPLTAIKAALSLVLEARSHEFDDEIVELLSLCERNAESLIGMVNELLESSRAEHRLDDVGVVRVDEVVDDVARGLAPLAKEQNVTVTVDAGQRCEAIAAEDGVRRVLANLVGNALKYAPNSHVHVAVAKTKDGVRVSVRDNGPGIPANKLESVFDPYTRLRTDVEQPGTGLGLAITRSLVEGFGGQIHVESLVGVGTTFVVTLKAPRKRRPRATTRATRFSSARS